MLVEGAAGGADFAVLAGADGGEVRAAGPADAVAESLGNFVDGHGYDGDGDADDGEGEPRRAERDGSEGGEGDADDEDDDAQADPRDPCEAGFRWLGCGQGRRPGAVYTGFIGPATGISRLGE